MKHSIRTALLLALPLLAGCSRSPENPEQPSGTSELGSAQILMEAREYSGMFSFDAGIEELYLLSDSGERTENLLSSPRKVELAGSQEKAVLLTSCELPAGEYTRMEVVFDPSSLATMDLGGNKSSVDVPEPRWLVDLDLPFVLDADTVERIWVSLDLEASLKGSPVAPPVEFHPQGEVYVDDDGDTPIDEFRGLVIESSFPRRTLILAAFNREERLGRVAVRVAEDTVLIDDNGVEFPNQEAFFRSLRQELTLVEVHAELEANSDVLVAKRIEIVDQGGGTGMPPVVEIEGMVLHIDHDSGFFVMLIREIEEGARIALPVLMGLGSPSSIDVYYDRETRFKTANGRPLAPDALRVGQIVDVEFSEFSEPPFFADCVELEVRGHCLSGEVISVENAPRAIVILVGGDEINPGADTSAAGRREVVVLLADAKIFVKVRGDRKLVRPADIVTGMKVKVCGELSRTDEGLVLAAEWVRLKPGLLVHGNVSATDPESSRFALNRGRVVVPFGDTVDGPPFGVGIDPRAVIHGDASSEAEFFRLYAGLEDGEQLEVIISGIATNVRAEIRAFGMWVKVRMIHPEVEPPDPTPDVSSAAGG